MEILKNIISSHPRKEQIRIIEHPENIGLGGTRNTAIEQAKGRYIFFMDSDDEITLDCIQKLYKEMIKVDVDIVCGSHKETGRIQENIKGGGELIILDYFNGKFPVFVWNKLYKLSFLRESNIKCIPNQTIEDIYFTFQVVLNAKVYSIIPDITYFYSVRTDSITRGGLWSKDIFRQLCQVFTDQLEYLQKQSLIKRKLKVKIREKLLDSRIYWSKNALMSPHEVQHYVNDYMNPAFFLNASTFLSAYLFAGYLLSSMPFSIKKGYLLFRIKNKQTKR
jgi:glycosyltransferase involved in cell wall biosynthesis